MKNKIILVLIFLLSIPNITGAYYSYEQFRIDIMNSIGTDQKRQQIQDIYDDQDRYNNQALNSYYRQLDNLQAENDFKLKQLQAEIDKREREESWQKEKELLDKQQEIVNENKKLQEEINKLKSGEKIDILEMSKKALEESGTNTTPLKSTKDLSYDSFLKEKQQKEQQTKKSEKGMFDYLFDENTEQPISTTTTQITPTEPITPTTIPPKKNVFVNLFDKFINLFK